MQLWETCIFRVRFIIAAGLEQRKRVKQISAFTEQRDAGTKSTCCLCYVFTPAPIYNQMLSLILFFHIFIWQIKQKHRENPRCDRHIACSYVKWTLTLWTLSAPRRCDPEAGHVVSIIVVTRISRNSLQTGKYSKSNSPLIYAVVAPFWFFKIIPLLVN